MRGDDDLAAIVRASSFELVSPIDGTLVGRLSEPVAGSPQLQLGPNDLANPSNIFMYGNLFEIDAPSGSWGNPPMLQMVADTQALLFSGGGLGIKSSDVFATHDGPTDTATAGVEATDGFGLPIAVVSASTDGRATLRTSTANDVRQTIDGVNTRRLTPQRGSVTVAMTGTPSQGTATITFPTAFTVAPTVVCTAVAITGNSPVTVCFTGAPSTTAANIIVRAVTDATTYTGNVTVYWVAHETL